ncbi:EAL domain-containing protein [Acidovorax sp.]|uniref:bifunctional diguanylate cyclase/phosphodiesterase n=1 Tax=Acidovorax sp. TaxID=1872122 RepID=UPI00391B2FDF
MSQPPPLPTAAAAALSSPPGTLDRLRGAVHQLAQAERLQRALFAIADLSGADLSMRAMLEQLHAIVGTLMYARNLFMALYDEDADTLEFIYFVDEATTDIPPLGVIIPMADMHQSLTWHLVRGGKTLRGSMDALAQQLDGQLQALGAYAPDWLGVPLRDGAQVRGVLVVQSYDQGGRYGPEEQELLEFVASHVLTAVQRRQTRQDLERAVSAGTAELARANQALQAEVARRQRGERLQAALYRIAERANDQGPVQDFYRAVHHSVGELLNARNFYIALLSEDSSELHFPYYVDENHVGTKSRPLGNGMTEYVLRNGQPLLASGDEIEQLHRQGVISKSGPSSRSWVGVPLVCEGRALGVVTVQSYQPEVTYTERDRDLLGFVSHQIASSLVRRRTTESLRRANAELEQRVAERTAELQEQIEVRRRVEAQLKHETLHDALTGLPNRSYLLERLDWLQSRLHRQPDQRFAVMFIDVDRFKLINDSMGHPAGDAVLQQIGRRLASVLRAPDMVARVGGDEFAVLVADAPAADPVVRIARRMLEVLDEPMEVEGKRLFASASIGISLCDRDKPNAADLLRNADTAMYRAKVNGRRRYELYDAHLHSDALRVLELENALWVAVKEQQFEPYFQPIVSLVDGSVCGYEALVRWHHPTEGLLTPGEFLRVAEDSGSIDAIDWQIYEAAAARMAQLVQTTGFAGYLSVNVAPRHFRQPGFGERMLRVLHDTGLPPQRLCLEITEGALIEDPERTSTVLHELRAHGMALALDDFGTGYSSLGYLHRLPLLTLKIDRSFVQPLDAGPPPASDDATAPNPSAAVVRAVLALAGSLGLNVVAEGIETPAQQQVLIDLGCTQGQGYLFGRPRPLGAPDFIVAGA